MRCPDKKTLLCGVRTRAPLLLEPPMSALPTLIHTYETRVYVLNQTVGLHHESAPKGSGTPVEIVIVAPY